ncbi:NAD(P)-binding protein [Acephala macrosclerotiorum]|nr:NAD(P)-binding protein [Acephala macrosclerotiorum]
MATIALVTGANKGIGFEISRQLASPPHNCHVLMACRDPGRGDTAVATLRGQGFSVEHVTLNVTDDDSIISAAKAVEEKHGHIDVLINNAGIIVGHLNDRSQRQAWKDTFDTNVFGVAAVTDAFIPLLKKSVDPAPRIVLVSSDLGRLETKYDPQHQYFKRPAVVYRCSKTALHMLALYYAADFRAGWGTNGKGAEWKINVTCPGPTKTDFNGNRAERPVEDGAKNAVRLAVLSKDGETGQISGDEGILPW